MNQRFQNKKVSRGHFTRYNQQSDGKNNFRGQDHYTSERQHNLSDNTIYNIARFLMGNEVVIVTKNVRTEGILRGFDSTDVWLSKVFVYDLEQNENFSGMKDILVGKYIPFRDILMVKVLSTYGKTDNVLDDQDISQRKQANKFLSNDDKNFIPYFDNYEGNLDDEVKDEDDDMVISTKNDQGCFYNPEDMLKINKEKFNVKSTFNDNMEEYTTQIDITDPLLQEKYERAEKLVREIENDASLRRLRLFEENDGEEDEEIMFSAVVTSVSSVDNKIETSASVKLNPNAPEFRPRVKSNGYESQHNTEDISLSNLHIISVESGQQQHLHMMPIDSAQHQMIQRLALQISMTPHTMAAQQCPVPRLVSAAPSQWTVPMNNNSTGQYMIQPYVQHGQLIPSMFQTRHITPEGTQNAGPGLFYSLGPLQGSLQGQYFVQPDHSPSVINDGSQHHSHHIFASSLDVVPAQFQQQLRQPHLMPTNIPVLQAAVSASQLQQLQQHQSHPQAHHTYYTQPSLNHSIMTGGQQMNSGGHVTFSQIIFNPQTQQQIQSGTASIQGYLPPTNNGRS